MKRTKLIALREAASMTQAEVASTLGISRSMYAMIESGHRLGSIHTIQRIADYYHCSVEEIMELYEMTLIKKS